MFLFKNTPAMFVLLFAVLLPLLCFAHGGHAPGLIGNPDELPDGAKVVKDPYGRLIYAHFDSNRDGKADVWNYYESGKLVRQELDENHDGEVDLRLFVWQGAVQKGQRDLNHDGVFDVEEQYQDGNLVLQKSDTNNDGAFDVFHKVEGNVHTSTEIDSDHNGRIDHWIFYDVNELPTLEWFDLSGDSTPDKVVHYKDGKPVAAPVPETDTSLEVDVENLAEQGDTVLDEVVVSEARAMTAASDQEVREKDFKSFPRQNPSDLVRLIPGVHVSQHTGGAKAYQYFLRGFDAEHGQDLAAYYDGIPLNEPSQVHGHGYLDLHFLIPETISSIKIIKGPYDPEYGNFATAGAINFIPRRASEKNTLGATAGMFGTAKVLATFGLEAEPYMFVGALETDHSEGYTDPGDSDAVRANTGHTFWFGNWALNVLTNHYAQDSAASDVIPEKWVEDGKVDRYGSLDPSDRVVSNRHLVGATLDYEKGPHSARIQGFYDYKKSTIWSNYTFYLFNPEKGDQQEMYDNRNVFGTNLKYTNILEWGPTIWTTAVGAQWRMDQVGQVLANTMDRERWNVINDVDFYENSIGVWLRENVMLAPWVTIIPGARFDMIQYGGEGTFDERYFNIYTNKADTLQDVEKDWNETASIFSPKGSVIFTPLSPWDIFVNYGEGFFSNTTLQMANDPQSNIPKVRGGEVGTRLSLWKKKLNFSAATWYADKEEDLVFDPQTGLSSTKDKTRRTGVDGEIRISPLEWLYLTTDASYVDARFLETGNRIPNGPIFLMTNGIGVSALAGFRGMLRGRYMGPRELDQEDWAPAFYVVDMVAGYDRESWGVELAIDNLFDTEWEDAVFSYETRPEKNGDTLNGIHWTPGTPFFARFSVTAKF